MHKNEGLDEIKIQDWHLSEKVLNPITPHLACRIHGTVM